MTHPSNKATVQAIFTALAEGDRKPFADAMAEDFSWTITGHGPWAHSWRGKAAVRSGLMAPLFAQFAGTYRNRATRIVCEGDTVCGRVSRQRGHPCGPAL